MKLRLFFSLALAMLLSVAVFAQESPKIKFEKTTHDFGELEKGAPCEYTFQFTNVSDAPIKLGRVKASCGCTTPSYTKEEVAPGANGTIHVKYNSQRVGPFSKTVTVTYDSVERPVVLYIKGKVNTVEDPYAAYPNKLGNLAFDKVNHNMGTLESNGEKQIEFKVVNTGPQPITFSKAEAEMMFEVDFADETLIPGQKSTFTVKAMGGRFMREGSFTHVITLNTDDSNQAEKPINLSGTLEKVYTAEELAAMPNIEFVNTTYDAGKVLEGELVEIKFEFTNSGQSDLEITSVKASCGCTASAPKDKIIKAGESSEIVATFNSRGRQGIQNKSITVRSNDPDNPAIVLRLKVEVEKDPFHINNAGPAAAPSNSRR
ncbi:MAG: DUF1573 domain-containing protein [Bacteroidota bacterium]